MGLTPWKRLLVGRPLGSDRLGEQLLPKRLALPIFASDPLSSVAYATQEILLVLAIGGTALLYLTPWIAAAVVVLLSVVVVSYRQVVRAYPSGGGSYEVAARNLGEAPALVVAAALMVDYVMTVAVSVAAGVDNIISALPALNPQRVLINVGFVVVLMVMNLRGVRESGRTFAIPTYLFIVGVLVMVAVGLLRTALGSPPVAVSAAYHIRAEHAGVAGMALAFLVLRAFASGCTALTGVEAISNGVPAFRPPKSANAARTMAAMGAFAITMFVGITALALISKVRITANACDLVGLPAGTNCATDAQRTVIAQVAAAVFGGTHSVLFFYIQATTALVLVLAANTAFNGFPLLGSILAKDRYLPRQLHNRGDRLAFSNGIVLLSTVAGLLVIVFDGSVTRLIQLYILGVFTSFTISQIGMVRHWNQLLATERDSAQRAGMHRSRVINAVGAVLTGLVLIIVLATKFTHGAYLVVIAVPVLFLLMRSIRRHYDQVAEELQPEPGGIILPSRVHAVILVSRLHRPTMKALAYARATRPDTITALTVATSRNDLRTLRKEWEDRRIPVQLTELAAPHREITRPVLEYVGQLRRESPRDVVVVYIPEYVVGHWWEQILHNRSALRLKARLLFQPGVMVTSVPWQLESSRSDQRPVAGPVGGVAVRRPPAAAPVPVPATAPAPAPAPVPVPAQPPVTVPAETPPP